ncbi:MAG: DUF3617 family protein [Xanthobacteraceae bacterium]|nr:MAG: DUF3617 family protein [Xanthobacteraceae bacterium]
MPRLAMGIVLACLASAAASAAELPTRKAGLWEMKMAREGAPAAMPVMQHCTDASTDKEMATMFGAMQEQCTQRDIRNANGAIVVDSVCSFGPMKSTSHAEITGDFNAAYTVTVKANVEGGPMPGPSTMTVEAKWLGPCKADQKPGDIMVPAMNMKMNIKDMQTLRGLMPK